MEYIAGRSLRHDDGGLRTVQHCREYSVREQRMLSIQGSYLERMTVNVLVSWYGDDCRVE